MNRRKLQIITGILLVACLLSLVACNHTRLLGNEDFYEYCTGIYNLLKDKDFFKAEIEKDYIILYDSEFKQISRMDFSGYKANMTIHYILNEHTRMLFVTSQAVDDTMGIVFFKDTENANLDGLWTLDRISGNGFLYSTFAQ